MLTYLNLNRKSLSALNRRLSKSFVLLDNGQLAKVVAVIGDHSGCFQIKADDDPLYSLGGRYIESTIMFDNFAVMPRIGWWYDIYGNPFTLESRGERTYKWGLNYDSYRLLTWTKRGSGPALHSSLNNMQQASFKCMFNVPGAPMIRGGRGGFVGLARKSVMPMPHQIYSNRNACEEFYGGFKEFIEPEHPENLDVDDFINLVVEEEPNNA